MSRETRAAQDPDVLDLDGTEIERGEQRVVRLPVAKLPIGTLIDMPVHVFRGTEAGPTVLLQGGLHGDEVGGVEILRRLLGEGLQPVRGTVLVVPVLNVFGFLHFSREVPDGKDVNRSFPGSPRGSLASRVAWTATHRLLPHVHMAVDLHTGGARRHNHPQVRYTVELPETRALAEVFGAPVHFGAGLIAKSFRKQAFRRKIPVIVYEAGESLRLHEPSILTGLAGIHRLLCHLDMLTGPTPSQPSRHLDEARWLRAPRSGLFRAHVEPGQEVAEGALLGEIGDPEARSTIELRSPFAGLVTSLNHLPVVNRGDAVIRVGR